MSLTQNITNRLRESNLFKIRFVTNTTKESITQLHELLRSLGLDIARNEIFSSLTAVRQLIEKQQLRPMLFLEPEAESDFEGIDCTNPNSVVIGLAPTKFDYETLNNAFKLVSIINR